MSEVIELLSSEWAIRAMLTSCMVGIMCGMLGTFLVLRNMSLIGDALSHAILPGIFFAFLILGAYSTIGFFIGSSIAGLIAALAMSWIQQNIPTKNDAAIGIIFTAMFSIGVIGISWLSHQEGVHIDMKDFLFGNVLGISNEDIWLTFGVLVYTIVSIVVFYRYLFLVTFQETIAKTMGVPTKMLHYFLMLLLSFVVVASLRAVGVILVVAMLITPAATALLLTDKLKIAITLAAFLGMISSVLGMFSAVLFDLPPGPAISIVATIFYFFAVLFSPIHGLVFKKLRERKETIRIEKEDIIKYLSKNTKSSMDSIAAYIGLADSKAKSLIGSLVTSNFITGQNNAYELTTKGVEQANELIRAHRLWETYQVEAMGLKEHQIHNYAEHMEHHLTGEILTEIDKDLGYPENDPHGSPIPKGK